MYFLTRGAKQREPGIVVADVRHDIITVNPINKYVVD